jgi:hypothetical protein
MESTVSDACRLTLDISDPEVVTELMRHPEGRARERHAISALRLGVLALRDARGELDTDTIRHEGDRLLTKIAVALSNHASSVIANVSSELRQYLDPTTGVLQARLDRLTKGDGEIDGLLAKHLAGDTSELARTLSEHVGKSSPLYKLLSPEDQDGFLKSLEASVSQILEAQRMKVIAEFDLNSPQSALSRLVREVSLANEGLRKDFASNVEAVLAQFSLDDKNSALSRLVAQVDAAQKKITTEFSFDDEKSALSRLRHELVEHVVRIEKTLSALESRKDEAKRSTRHGIEFEDAVCNLLAEEARQWGDIASACGATTGRISYCKVGDFTAELGPESSAPGKRVVVEAKAEQGYRIADALTELATARENRGAEIGLFVFAQRSAPNELKQLSRYGNDIVIMWDPDDCSTDLVLRTAYSLARALAIANAKQQGEREVDFAAIDTCMAEIRRNTDDLDEILDCVRTIGNAAEKAEKRARLVKKRILELMEDLQAEVAGLRP